MHHTHASSPDAGPSPTFRSPMFRSSKVRSSKVRSSTVRATTVRALTGLLLGAAAGAIAALAAPRRSTTAGDEEGPVPLPS